MSNPLGLIPGQKYILIKSFTDYDGRIHEAGETWIFKGTDFLPYEDGLTVKIEANGSSSSFRMQWQDDAQGKIIDNFKEYIV
jgi:hypothetical protein